MPQSFAIKFKTVEFAQEFKKAFEDAQIEMKVILEGKDASSGGADADAAAEAIASVTVKAEEDDVDV